MPSSNLNTTEYHRLTPNSFPPSGKSFHSHERPVSVMNLAKRGALVGLAEDFVGMLADDFSDAADDLDEAIDDVDDMLDAEGDE